VDETGGKAHPASMGTLWMGCRHRRRNELTAKRAAELSPHTRSNHARSSRFHYRHSRMASFHHLTGVIMEYNYEDRPEPVDSEVIEITEETLEQIGGGAVGVTIWF
jgi:hypothetical protein